MWLVGIPRLRRGGPVWPPLGTHTGEGTHTGVPLRSRRLRRRGELTELSATSILEVQLKDRSDAMGTPVNVQITREGLLIPREALGDVDTEELDAVREEVARRGAAGCRVCVLLRKDRPRPGGPGADFVGFDIPDVFVVGYGLDLDGRFRNLPDVVAVGPGREGPP